MGERCWKRRAAPALTEAMPWNAVRQTESLQSVMVTSTRNLETRQRAKRMCTRNALLSHNGRGSTTLRPQAPQTLLTSTFLWQNLSSPKALRTLFVHTRYLMQPKSDCE